MSIPKVFISYSHDDDDHREWVRKLAGHLRFDYAAANIDQYVEPAPKGGWWDWAAKEIEFSNLVMCVCTAGYHDRYREAVNGKGQGVRQEAGLVNNLLPDGATKVCAIFKGQSNGELVPLPLRGCAQYSLPVVLHDPKDTPRIVPGGDYGKLLVHIRGGGGVAPPPFGPPPLGSDSFQTLSTLDGARRPFAKLRLTFYSIGGSTYRVTLQSRKSTGGLFVNFRAQVEINDDLNFLFRTIDQQTGLRVSSTIKSAREAKHPIRIQVHLLQSARRLDRLDWETAPLLDRRLHEHGDVAFSRSFAIQDEEAPDIRISPKKDLEFTLAHATMQPAVGGRDPGHLVWSGLDAYGEDAEVELAELGQIVSWGDGYASSFAHTLSGVDVLFLPLLVAADKTPGKAPLLVIPDAKGDLFAASIGDLVKEFLGLAERPIVIFLAPSGYVHRQPGETYEVTSEIASELAERGVASVVHLHRPIEHDAWIRFLAQCSSALREVGVIDEAVAFAKNCVPEAASTVRLYLRNKSARLWYEPGFSLSKDHAQLPWEDLNKVFEAATRRPPEDPRCVVILGPGVDRELKLTRRSIARDMARSYGFSLSHRDEESLARVAEFIRAHGSDDGLSSNLDSVGSTQEAGVQESHSVRPHVRAFLERVHSQLWKDLGREQDTPEFKNYRPQPNLDIPKTLALIKRMSERRTKEEGTLYANLARLRVSTFVTTNFHGILQMALLGAGRDPTTAYSIVQSARYRQGRTTARNFCMSKNDRTIAVNNPLVYHAYGTFDDLDSLVLAESDHLGFFADFITPHERNAAWDQIKGQLVDGTLIFLGFHPDSWSFRVLFAAITQLSGSDAISMKKPHVAVQLDPEDDLIIDPEGAKSYFEGLLKPLGAKVFVYWGSPGTFLEDMRSNVSPAFLNDSSIAQSES